MWWEIAIIVITNLSTGFFTWLFSREKENAETESVQLQNIQSELDIYKSLLDDTKMRVEELLEVNKHLRDTVEQLEEEVRTLRQRLDES